MNTRGPHVCYRGCGCGARMSYDAPPHVCGGSFCTTCSGNAYSAEAYATFGKAALLFAGIVAAFLLVGCVGYGFVSLFPGQWRMQSATAFVVGLPLLLIALAASWSRLPGWSAKASALLGAAFRRGAAGRYRLSGDEVPDARTTVRRAAK